MSQKQESESESDESAVEETFNTLQARKRRQHKKVVKILRGKGIPINPENPEDMWDVSNRRTVIFENLFEVSPIDKYQNNRNMITKVTMSWMLKNRMTTQMLRTD